MKTNVIVDCKFLLAVGTAISMIILSLKVNPSDAEKAIGHLSKAFYTINVACNIPVICFFY